MEGVISSVNLLQSCRYRLFHASVSLLLVAISYVDPGKWAAMVEGGAHFGLDLVLLVLLFNFAAILCQYISAHISVVTGRDLVQIFHDEYDGSTCICLGVQTELSVIALDLSMILGIAHVLNLIFGMDLMICVCLTSIEAVIFPLFATFLEKWIAQILTAGFIMLFYVFGVVISQPEIPFSMSWAIPKLSGESAFTLMSLLGASMMPHNLYVHSYFVKHKGMSNSSDSALYHDHFFAILPVFSGIFFVNYVLINLAANEFHSTGLVLLTFQDVLSLDQVFRSPVAHFGFLLILLFFNQIIASSWNIVGQIVLHDFLRVNIPIWIHRVTIRLLAILPALYFVSTSGAEGILQLLILTQVVIALLLPPSVIPLFRVASSRSIMGVYKISPFVEFLVLLTFIGMLGLNIIFVVEMVFGNSDWVGNLRWNMSNSMSVSHIVLLIISCTSFCFVLWLVATPLKSARLINVDTLRQNWDMQNLEPFIEGESNDFDERSYHELQEHVQQPQQPSEILMGPVAKSRKNVSVTHFPETIPDQKPQSNITEESLSHSCHVHEMKSTMESPQVDTAIVNEISDHDSVDTSSLKSESIDPLEKTVGIARDIRIVKDDEVENNWETEESKRIPTSSPTFQSDGPGSFRNLNGKSDEVGTGPASLSRLAGLSRAARRQLTIVLDEFWCQLYDYHGQASQEAMAKKFDLLLGVNSKPAHLVETHLGLRPYESMKNSGLYDTSSQKLQSNLESPYGVQTGSSQIWPNYVQFSTPYDSSLNTMDYGERRYSSLCLPHSSDACDYQPATVHGYQISSYLNQLAKNNKTPDHLPSQMDSSIPKSMSLSPTNYRDSLAIALSNKLQTGTSPGRPPGFENVTISRNSPLQLERSNCEIRSSGPADSVVNPSSSKKYHSLPDISGLSVPYRDYIPNRSVKWNGVIGFGSSVGRSTYEQSIYSGVGSRVAFEGLSSSCKVSRDSLPLRFMKNSGTGSMWSTQPLGHFDVVNNRTCSVGTTNGVASSPSTIPQIDLEVKLLVSLRQCIVKLLKLEGSGWLFRQNDGVDEDLIDRVASWERFFYESESKVDLAYVCYDIKSGTALKKDDSRVSCVPHCGNECIWSVDLVISFGVWCMHRILELSLMESRPELWGKYTYVLNRLQGIIDLAFSKPRSPKTPCFCLQIPASHVQRSSPSMSNGILPIAIKTGRGKSTTGSTLLEIIKDIEIAISCRKGRQGTAAGDVAFPKGKENLASVLKRYKRRLSTKQLGGPSNVQNTS